MNELIKLSQELKSLLNECEENLGGEKVQPYIIILKAIKDAINNDIKSEDC
ncbi:MAG: hypothetical protein ACOCRX_01965 [Candidatus Woesearchaeota archaeon]